MSYKSCKLTKEAKCGERKKNKCSNEKGVDKVIMGHGITQMEPQNSKISSVKKKVFFNKRETYNARGNVQNNVSEQSSLLRVAQTLQSSLFLFLRKGFFCPMSR